MNESFEMRDGYQIKINLIFPVKKLVKIGIMSNNAQNKNINEYVIAFMQKICEDNEYDFTVFENAWKTDDNQNELSKLIKSKTVKAKKVVNKVKDPNKPKRGKSAYLFFCADERSVVKKLLGDNAMVKDVTAELGIRWKGLKESLVYVDQERLKKYEQQAAEDKIRYENEMNVYEPPSDEELEKIKKQGKRKKDKDAPKRGKSAYIFFCAEMRAKVKEELGEDSTPRDVTARLGELWHIMKEDESRIDEIEKYNKMAMDDKIRYEGEIKEYIPSESDDSEESRPNEIPVAKTGKKGSGKKGSGKKANGYTLFCRDHRMEVKAENPDMKASDVTKELARMWKNLTADEQQEWVDAANQQK